MARKLRKIDDFLSGRKKSQETVLEEKTRLSNRLFRAGVGLLLTVLLIALAGPAEPAYTLARGCLIFLVVGMMVLSLRAIQPGLFERATAFNQLILLVVIEVLLYQLAVFMYTEEGWSMFIAPLALFGMVAALVFSEGTALLLVGGLAFYMGLTSPRREARADPLGIDIPLLLVVALGAATAVLTIRPIRKQSRPVVVGLYAGAVQAVAIILCKLLVRHPPFDFSVFRDANQLRVFLHDPAWGLAGGIVYGGVVTCLLPGIERFFGILTERRLLDLTDFQNDLLKLLQERAPGTFQHTLGVAQLASNAAEAIGADPLLARVGAYYHDVGKISKPEYFVENMGEDKSIHDRLRPSLSKLIIVAHVKDGILLAREAKLPQRIVDMIPMHHGTTLVEYFYQKAKRVAVPDTGAPGDVEFRYPGPKPRFREAGILMLADTLEAMAKAESQPNPSRFRAMVHEVILKRLLDGQLDESDLTLNDLRVVEDSFVRTLTTMYHGRIKYYGGELGGVSPPPSSWAELSSRPPASSSPRAGPATPAARMERAAKETAAPGAVPLRNLRGT
jgi:putative nucleotidyltransferase with HDIG domain